MPYPDYEYENPVEQPFGKRTTSTDLSFHLFSTASDGANIDGYSVRDTNRGQSLQKTVEELANAQVEFATLQDIDDLFDVYE